MRRSALSPCVNVWCVPSSPIAVICCGTGASAWVGQVGTRCALTGRFTVKQGSGPEVIPALCVGVSRVFGPLPRLTAGGASPLRIPLPCAPSCEGAVLLLANEFERCFVRAQVFPNDIAEAVVTTSALKLRLVRALGVHVCKQVSIHAPTRGATKSSQLHEEKRKIRDLSEPE